MTCIFPYCVCTVAFCISRGTRRVLCVRWLYIFKEALHVYLKRHCQHDMRVTISCVYCGFWYFKRHWTRIVCTVAVRI